MKAIKVILLLFIICSFHSGICTAQWVKVSNVIGNRDIYSLAATGNYIFAGTDPSGVYLSTNDGTNWTQTSLNNRTVNTLTINGNDIFAGTENYGVYLSQNNGATWLQISLNNRDIRSLIINANDIYAGTNLYGVYKNGIQTSLNNRYVYSLASNGNNIFAGTTNYGVYLSTNNGTTWAQTSLNNLTVYSLAINGNKIFAGTGSTSGVYLSTNNGTTWTQTPLNNVTVYSQTVIGNNIFAGTFQNGVFISTDNGTNWTQKNEGLGILSVNAFCVLNDYIFAGTIGNSVYRRPLSELIGIQPISNEVPKEYSLSQNYPNPFNPVTKIRFSIPVGTRHGAFIKIIVFDVTGREVAILVNEQLKPGTYEVEWYATNFPSGVYYYTLSSGEFSETGKAILVK